MATASRTPSVSAQRAQVLRNVWKGVEQRGASLLGPVLAFLVASPAWAQGIYYVLTGLWPLASPRTLLAVTEPRTELWLVQMVGVLVTVIGGTLCVAAYRRQATPEVLFLAFGSAVGLAAAELIFVLQRRASVFYLLDVLVELGLVALWVHHWRQRRQGQAAPVGKHLPG